METAAHAAGDVTPKRPTPHSQRGKTGLREVAVLLLSLAAPFPARAQKTDEAQLKAAVDGAKDVRKLAKPLAADAQAKIEKALGRPLDKSELPPKLFAIPAGRDTLSACAVAVAGPRGPVRVAVVVGKDVRGLQGIQKVVLLSHKEDRAIEDEEFLGQFLERTATVNAYNPPAVLEEAEAKGDAETKRLIAFLRGMNENHALYQALAARKVPKKDVTAAEEAKALAARFETLAGQADAFGGVLKAADRTVFARQAKEGLELARKAEAAVARRDWVAAQSAYDEIACAKCHGNFRRAFKDRRQALQIGDGYFKVGHDVYAAAKGAEAASQAVATGVRKALLILDRVLQ